jgi:hypothetical protein
MSRVRPCLPFSIQLPPHGRFKLAGNRGGIGQRRPTDSDNSEQTCSGILDDLLHILAKVTHPGGLGDQADRRMDHRDRDDLVISKMNATQATLGNRAVLDSEGPLADMWQYSGRPFAYSCIRWRILVGWAAGPIGGPVFAAARPRRIAETSVADIVSLTGLGAATKYRLTRGLQKGAAHNGGYLPIIVSARRRKYTPNNIL